MTAVGSAVGVGAGEAGVGVLVFGTALDGLGVDVVAGFVAAGAGVVQFGGVPTCPAGQVAGAGVLQFGGVPT